MAGRPKSPKKVMACRVDEQTKLYIDNLAEQEARSVSHVTGELLRLAVDELNRVDEEQRIGLLKAYNIYSNWKHHWSE